MFESRRVRARITATCRRMRWHLLFVLALYVASFAAGYAAIGASLPFALDLRTNLLKMITTEAPFTTVIGTLRSGDLLIAIAFTFIVNLTSGAFLSTTLLGVIPLLGSGGISLVTIYRGFSLGVVYYAVLSQSSAALVLAVGTLVLELGAYVFSGAAGIALSLATVFPKRYEADGRWAAFKKAWTDTATLYILVVVLLLAGAIWEMTGLFLLSG